MVVFCHLVRVEVSAAGEESKSIKSPVICAEHRSVCSLKTHTARAEFKFLLVSLFSASMMKFPVVVGQMSCFSALL